MQAFELSCATSKLHHTKIIFFAIHRAHSLRHSRSAFSPAQEVSSMSFNIDSVHCWKLVRGNTDCSSGCEIPPAAPLPLLIASTVASVRPTCVLFPAVRCPHQCVPSDRLMVRKLYAVGRRNRIFLVRLSARYISAEWVRCSVAVMDTSPTTLIRCFLDLSIKLSSGKSAQMRHLKLLAYRPDNAKVHLEKNDEARSE